jgi:hypothetical protein
METDGKGIELIQASARAEFSQADRNGVLFTNKKMEPVLFDPQPVTLKVGTLGAIRDFLTANIDGLQATDIVLHVATERAVSLVSKLDGPNLKRKVYLEANAEEPGFALGNWMDPEAFIIGIQTQFVPSEITAGLLKVVGNIQNGAARTNVDDGVSQTVNAKVGVQLSIVDVPSPIVLAPFRTFREVIQPASVFILRARAGSENEHPKLALFIADGNLWRLDAIKNVANWLREQIPAVTVLA